MTTRPSVKNWQVVVAGILGTLLCVAISCTITAIWTEDERWARTAELFWILFCVPVGGFIIYRFLKHIDSL